MQIIDWILYSLLPIFGVTAERLAQPALLPWLPECTLEQLLTSTFVIVFGIVALHLLLIVPYRVILRLCHYKGVRFK